MTFKTILTPVEASPDRLDGVRAALAVARTFDAALVGAGAGSLGAFTAPAARLREPELIGALRQAIEDNLTRAERLFRELAGEAGIEHVWRSVDARPTEAVVRLSAGADLIVMAAPTEDDSDACADVGGVILGAGAPVLIAPPGGAGLAGERVVIGWKNTREARRAVADALPFLKRAKRVLIASFEEPGSSPAAPQELEDLQARLARHGVAAEMRTKAPERTHPADLLVELAQQEGADLIVIGGYGHLRLQDWVFGGVTGLLINRSPLFVLFGR